MRLLSSPCRDGLARRMGLPCVRRRWWGSDSCGWPGFVEGSVAEYREEDVGSSSGEAEAGLGVVLSLGDLFVVVGPRSWIGQSGERGQEEGPLELFVSSPGVLFAPDRGARVAGCRGESLRRRRGGWRRGSCCRRRPRWSTDYSLQAPSYDPDGLVCGREGSPGPGPHRLDSSGACARPGPQRRHYARPASCPRRIRAAGAFS